MKFKLAATFAISILIVTPVAAEVMDKEPSAIQNWLFALVTGAVAIPLWRWRWWLGAVVSLPALAFIFGVYQEINDPFVGADIRREAGSGYVTQFYLSAALGCILHSTAAYAGLRRVK